VSPIGDAVLFACRFTGPAFVWRGPAPFLFIAVPPEHDAEIRFAARQASYGWGVIPVAATIADFAFTTSLIPRDGAYLLPIKLAVQRATGVGPGSEATVDLRIEERG